ncbi:unnamed protein product [Chrysoparadoxa australica]
MLYDQESVEPGSAASSDALAQALDGDHEYLWIVDPIDGTTNFVHAMPLSAVSIGIADKAGNLVIGVIYDPHREEMFHAVKGCGAFLNGAPLHVGEQATLEEAVVAAGAPPTALALGPALRGITALAPKVRTMRLLGSAAIMLAWVACGRLTAYFEADLNAWDIAAGALIIMEAGGHVTEGSGAPYSLATRSVVGSNSLIHSELQEVLQAADAVAVDTEPRV